MPPGPFPVPMACGAGWKGWSTMGAVFISYVEEDAALARELAVALEGLGYAAWYYERDSLPGPSYLEQVVAAVARAQAVILLISPATLPSFQVERELILAYEAGTPVVPLLWELTHAEMRAGRPAWAMMLGGATSIAIPGQGGVAAILPQLGAGLRHLGVAPSRPPEPVDPNHTSETSTAQGQSRYRLQAPATPLVGHEREVEQAVSLLPSQDSNFDGTVKSHGSWQKDAPTVDDFYGREKQLADLQQWIINDRCRVVTVLGIGGVGKSALRARTETK